VTLKIITKTIANRLKTILPDITSPNQSAFVQGRLISDNTLIAHEIFNFSSHSATRKVMLASKQTWQKLMTGWSGTS
jgi:cytochrome c-type biogenesis protein CcmE